MAGEAGLAKGALGVVESAVMGIAGTAPAFSVAVTTATFIAAVGTLSVGSILYCGLIMFGLMLAFSNLNKMSPNAGAAFAWGIIYIVTDHFAFGQFEAQKKPRFAPHCGQTDLMLLRAILRATAAAFSPVPAGR